MKKTKWLDLVIPALIFVAPILLITVTFDNPGRL